MIKRHRIKIQRLIDVAPSARPSSVISHYHALSRPHFGEELDRLATRISEAHVHQGVGLGARVLHDHPVLRASLDHAWVTGMCGANCLLVTAVELSEPKDSAEIEREKVTG